MWTTWQTNFSLQPFTAKTSWCLNNLVLYSCLKGPIWACNSLTFNSSPEKLHDTDETVLSYAWSVPSHCRVLFTNSFWSEGWHSNQPCRNWSRWWARGGWHFWFDPRVQGVENHPYLLHRQWRLLSATHIKAVLSTIDLSLEPCSEQQLTLVRSDSAGRGQLLNRLVLGSFGLLCLSVDKPHFLNPIFQLLASRVTHHGHVHAVCFTQWLVSACRGLLVVHGGPWVALRRCTTASLLVAPSGSRSVLQSRAPGLYLVDPSRRLWLLRPASQRSDSSEDCRRVIHKTLPNDFDRHDPSVLRGLDGEDLSLWRFLSSMSLRNLDLLDHQLTSSWMVGFFLCPVSVTFCCPWSFSPLC